MNTDRLIIRPIEHKDFADLCEYGCDEETGQYMLHWPKTKEQLKEYIEYCVDSMSYLKPRWYEFVLQLKDTAKVIGNITLMIEDEVTEIGWISNKNYWNHGFMSEAAKAVIDYAFQNLDIQRIIATCTEKNTATWRVMEKCNMVRIKTEHNYKAVRQGVEVVYTKFTYCIEKGWQTLP